MRWFGVELENFQFLLVRVEADVSEQRRREVTLARVRQHGEDSVARLGALAHLRRARESAAGGDVDKDSFLLRQRAAPFHRVGAGNGENAADHAGVDGVCCELRDESLWPGSWAASLLVGSRMSSWDGRGGIFGNVASP